MSRTQPNVILHQAVYMQRIADWVRLGYIWWTAGCVPAERAMHLARKFAIYYRTDLDRNRRARAKARGEGCAVLLLHPVDSATLAWTLLVTPGEHPAHKLERLRDAFVHRVVVDDYELVRHSRPGQQKPSWTWRMQQEAYQAWRDRIRQAVRQGHDWDVKQMLASLHSVPGFAGVRAQAKTLQRLILAEWRRVRAGAPPTLPKLRYIRRLPTTTLPLNTWVHQATSQARAAVAASTAANSSA